MLSCQQPSKEINEDLDYPSKLLYERKIDDTTIVVQNQNDSKLTENEPKWEWVKKIMKSGSITPSAYAKTIIDSSGNSYITNYIPTLNNNNDIYVAKYDTNGDLVWELLMGGKGRDSGHDVAIDRNGNIWVVGFFYEKANFGEIVLTGDNEYNLFLVKIDSSGVCKNAYKVASDNRGFSYSRQTIGSGQLGGFSISINDRNEIILSGEFEEKLSFNNIRLT